MPDPVTIEISSGIATLTLNNPKKLNAFSDDMLFLLSELVDKCENNDHVKVIVLTGAGKAFSAGGDISNMGEVADNRPHVTRQYISDVIQAFPKLMSVCKKPTIASINGVAAGGGLDLALACDIRVGGESCKMAETYCKIGLLPGGGGAWFLPRIVGKSMALEMLLSGKFIDAGEAKRIGLINHVWPDTELVDQTRLLASSIAKNPPLSVALIKQAVNDGTNSDLITSLDLIASHIAIAKNGPDHLEAINAFKEKREGSYVGF
jgi:2-(1,2-epoxy-1,2-dihydrophenyl)acetyl-CoA isomerase